MRISLSDDKPINKPVKKIVKLKKPIPKWWKELDKEGRKDYITKHPRSRFAKMAKLKQEERKKLRGIKLAPRVGKVVVKKGVRKIGRVVKHTGIATKGKAKQILKDQHDFFRHDQEAPGSKTRRTFGRFIKDKAKGIVKAMKHEVKEWKTAAGAMKKLAHRQKLDHHDKAALKAIAIHTALVLGPMAITGGLSVGLSHALPAVATHMLEHSIALNIGRAMVFASASDLQGLSDDELMTKLVEGMGQAMIDGPIPKEAFAKGFEQAAKDA